MVDQPFPDHRIEACGDSCMVVVFDQANLQQANRAAHALARRISAADFPGIRDVVPSMVAVSIHYNLLTLDTCGASRNPWNELSQQIQSELRKPMTRHEFSRRKITLPVCYNREYGEDLENAARECGISVDELVTIHSRSTVTVMMLGFAPGHPYLGVFDDRLNISRRTTPRSSVPKGSVALANQLTVIYPTDSPSGWNVIGRTPLSMFDSRRCRPCLLKAGDQVCFKPITPKEFSMIEREQRGDL